MKTNVKSRLANDSFISGETSGKGKKLLPEKKQKNIKRALYQEIEEDEDIDFLSFKRNGDSIENYYDDEGEYLDDEDFDESMDDEFDEDYDEDED